ncbi:hypothetical protein [Microbulbifer guangxiensis]|nr:hypothetical protein [Microbulbifer guangxiensis]
MKAHGREQSCEQLRLNSGVQRSGAYRFYLREGFDINSHPLTFSEFFWR